MSIGKPLTNFKELADELIRQSVSQGKDVFALSAQAVGKLVPKKAYSEDGEYYRLMNERKCLTLLNRHIRLMLNAVKT